MWDNAFALFMAIVAEQKNDEPRRRFAFRWTMGIAWLLFQSEYFHLSPTSLSSPFKVFPSKLSSLELSKLVLLTYNLKRDEQDYDSLFGGYW